MARVDFLDIMLSGSCTALPCLDKDSAPTTGLGCVNELSLSYYDTTWQEVTFLNIILSESWKMATSHDWTKVFRGPGYCSSPGSHIGI